MARAEDKSAGRAILGAGAATVALGLALARGWEPGIAGEWVWEQSRVPVHLAPAVAACVLLVLAAMLLCRPRRWAGMRPVRRAVSLAALVVLAVAVQWTLLTAVGPPSRSWTAPGWVIASPNATTYFSASFDVGELRGWVASYPRHMWQLPHHARTHPPGFILVFLALRRAAVLINPHPGPALAEIADQYNRQFGLLLGPADAAAAIGSAVVISLLGALSLVPLYLLGREMVGEEGAICAATLAAAMPGLLLLGASPDQIVLALAVTCLWLCYSAWRGRSALRFLLAGAASAVGLFFSLAFGIVVAWMMVWGLLGALRSEDRGAAARRAVIGGVAVAAGFLLVHLALYLVWGYRPLSVAGEALFAHRGITTAEFPRSYWKWLLMNPLEVAIFVGLPLVTAAIWSWPGLSRGPEWARLRPLLAAWLVVLVVLNLSGAVRGEVGRIWLFLFWPAALAAGAWLASRPRLARLVPALVAFQAAQVLLMRGYLTIYSIL